MYVLYLPPHHPLQLRHGTKFDPEFADLTENSSVMLGINQAKSGSIVPKTKASVCLKADLSKSKQQFLVCVLKSNIRCPNIFQLFRAPHTAISRNLGMFPAQDQTCPGRLCIPCSRFPKSGNSDQRSFLAVRLNGPPAMPACPSALRYSNQQDLHPPINYKEDIIE